jgi:heme oxygenase (mycobilin-producing)
MPAAGVIVVTRFIVPDDPAGAGGVPAIDFAANAGRLQSALATRPGHLGSQLVRALDDPTRWVLVSEWVGVGPWRRALSNYEVRVEVMPLMALAEAEPSVYETIPTQAPAGAGQPDA